MPVVRTMLPRSRRFHIDAMVGFAVIIVLLTSGMGFALWRMEQITARQLAEVRAQENEITAVERLRWMGEVMVSAGKSYLISVDPKQLEKLTTATSEFDEGVRALETMELSPVGETRIEAVRGAATTFRNIQKQILNDRRSTELRELVDRFDTELRPARRVFRESLDLLVGHQSAVMERVYADARDQRASLTRWVYGLLISLVGAGICVAWVSAKRLERMYRRESDAVKTAQRALGARDEVMGIVAHDLRSPLGAITMRAELLHDSTTDPVTRNQAAAINSTATRMALLINSMLDVAVIEAGHLTVHTVPCDADRFVRDAIDMFSVLAASKEIHIDSRVSEPGLVVMADRERVIQVLSNLLGNAMKFTPRGGRVTLSVERSGQSAAFAVSDTGPGIPTENLEHVFDRYWKDERRGTKGTGLGLFIAKSIIDAHGGRIWAESKPGQGATFRFELPLASRPDPSARRWWQTS